MIWVNAVCHVVGPPIADQEMPRLFQVDLATGLAIEEACYAQVRNEFRLSFIYLIYIPSSMTLTPVSEYEPNQDLSQTAGSSLALVVSTSTLEQEATSKSVSSTSFLSSTGAVCHS